MSYKVNPMLGHKPWRIENPWVFADLSQPQRHRNGVSPYVWQTHPPRAGMHPLGQGLSAEEARAQRMERYALVGLALSALSFGFFVYNHGRKKTA